MKQIKTVHLFFIMLILYSCSSSKVITTWKALGNQREYKKILVVGIVKDSSINLRKQMEKHLADDLKTVGYNAVPALEEFGQGGLANLEQEQTYIKLCGKGIDAVITIALLDRKKEKLYVPARVKYYSSLYYYNRIWNYNSIQADLTSPKGHYEESTQYLWETILFDLPTLSPVYTVQTKTFDPASLNEMGHEHGKLIVSKMLKDKILPPVAQAQNLQKYSNRSHD
jgi:hypothetical protein